MGKRISNEERTEARTALRELFQPGDTVATLMRHVSRSGMSRSISVLVCYEDGPGTVDGLVARAIGEQFDQNHGGVKMGGVGMDMGFALVYQLGLVLWPEGFPCVGERCRSNDHSNGDWDYTPGHVVHPDGGYALRQRWL